MSEWQPIETAPNGPVLVFGVFAGEIHGPDDAPSIGVAYRGSGRGDYPGYKWVGTQGDAYAVWCKPTHWMPLPEPPK